MIAIPARSAAAAQPSKWSRPAREARRLTAEERTLRAVPERDFQRQVCDLAELLGWTWCHWRPLRNGRGIWQVPVEGPLGKGWPDLTLVRARDRRLIFAELKREDQDPSPDQIAVLEQLELAVGQDASCGDGPHIDRARFGDQPEGFGRWLSAGKPEARFACCPPLIEVYVWRPSDLADPIETSTIGRILR